MVVVCLGSMQKLNNRVLWYCVCLWWLHKFIDVSNVEDYTWIYIEGSLRTRDWEDDQGNKRYTTEIIGREMQMLGGRRSEDNMDQSPQMNNSSPQPEEGLIDDEIPF